MSELRAQFVLPDKNFPVDTLVTPSMDPNDNVDTLVTKQFEAIDEKQLQENLTHPGVAPVHMWGTTGLTSVRLLTRCEMLDAQLFCNCCELASI